MGNTIENNHQISQQPYLQSNQELRQVTSSDTAAQISKNTSTLAVSDGLKLQQRVLSQTIDNATNGIALANIAQEGLKQQSEILQRIYELTSTKTLNQEDNKMIVNEVDKLLQSFEDIAESTTYNGEVLLQISGDEADDDLSIAAEEKIVSIYKADTTTISDNLRIVLGEFFSNPASREGLLEVLKKGIDQLASFTSEYKNVSNTLEVSVEKNLTQTVNSANSRPKIADTDYGVEVTNYSKANVLAQMGYFMQTQANAHQNRTIDLLK
jgi:flagellin